jgi:hypothetical protein
MLDGNARFDNEKVASGDAAEVDDADVLTVEAITDSELILIDVPLSFQPIGSGHSVELRSLPAAAPV